MSDSAGDVADVQEVVEENEPKPDKAEAGILKDLQSERAKRREAEAALAAFQEEQRKAADAKAAEQGEFKRLYEETLEALNPLKEEVQTYREREAARVEAQKARQIERRAALPDAVQALIPEGLEGDALDAHLSKLEAIAAKGAATIVATGGRSTGGGGDATALTEAEKKHAERHNLQHLSAKVIKAHFAKLNPQTGA